MAKFDELKARAQGMVGAVDEFAAQAYDAKMNKLEGWIKNYMRVAGCGLIFGLIMAAYNRNNVLAWLFFCTLHLQIILNYTLKKFEGKKLWTPITETAQTSEPKISESG